MRRTLFLAAVCVSLGGTAHANTNTNTCLRYREDVSLQGTLTRQTFPEQPNYESIAHGDAKATYFLLKLDPAVCVAPGDDEDEAGEGHVNVVQLVFMGKEDMFGPLRPSLGKKVQCSGQLMHAFSGHHHSRILFTTSRCQVVSGIKK